MNGVFTLILAITCSFLTQASALIGNDVPTIVRPIQIDAKKRGCLIGKPDDYVIAVGDKFQIEYSFPETPNTTPNKISYKMTNQKTIGIDKPVIRSIVTPKVMGTRTKSICFRGTNTGKVLLTIVIDDHEYDYSLTVVGVDSGKPDFKKCRGSYFAIQTRGTVFVFANGVHPTAGYETDLKKANIAIWPPQFNLQCRKPSEVVAQVVTPFSVQASFESEGPVKSVVIHDLDGQHPIKVVQQK